MIPILTEAVICIGFYTSMLGSTNLDVPLTYQYPDYPTACESVATVEMLQYNGYNLSISEFLDNYLDTIDSDDSSIADFDNVFDHYFVGNPYSSHGFLCNPPVEVKAVQKYFSEINESNRSVLDLTGTSFENLLDLVSQGSPVVIWCSINLVEPTRRFLYNSEYFTPSHAVVLSGYDVNTGKITLTDSISGVVEADYERVKYLYNVFSRKSLVVR